MLNPAIRTGWCAMTLAFGLIVTVQGFETSRYLRADCDAAVRIRFMRYVQLLLAAIYMVYIGLLAYGFESGQLELDETAIIGMMKIVVPILPVLPVAAALSTQFSAAVADTSGSGGLIAELTPGRVSHRQGYAVLVAFGLVLTWAANVVRNHQLCLSRLSVPLCASGCDWRRRGLAHAIAKRAHAGLRGAGSARNADHFIRNRRRVTPLRDHPSTGVLDLHMPLADPVRFDPFKWRASRRIP